jgi:hypothetical protein
MIGVVRAGGKLKMYRAKNSSGVPSGRVIPVHRPLPLRHFHHRSDWGASEHYPRGRYYSITATGRRQLADEEEKLGRLDGGRGAGTPVRVGKESRHVLDESFDESISSRPGP